MSRTRIAHLSRNVKQRFSTPKVGVIGGYHGGNLGDMALGSAVTNVLSAQGVTSGLQTIYNLNQWPTSPFAIIGGGAVGYIDLLSQVAQRYKSDFQKVALLGVDFNEKQYPQDCLDLLRGSAYVSCRSEKQAQRLIELTGRQAITHHPDIAFSLMDEFCSEQRKQKIQRQKKLLVNAIPLYGKIVGDKVIPAEEGREERPELYNNFQTMQDSYRQVLRGIVQKAIEQGYAVETIPFTPWDAEYGRIVFDGLDVNHSTYHSNPVRMIKTIAKAEWVVATRFHATIFALKAGVRLTPIAYAVKNEVMLQELGLSRDSFLSTTDLAGGVTHIAEPVVIRSEMIRDWEVAASQAVRSSISALLR